ncbi:MAG: acetylglutamate kinase [Candidatus Limnocylindria bacterium]
MTRPLTVKLGGHAGEHVDLIARAAPDDCVIVHGGGAEVGHWSRRLGIEPEFRDGLRVTDDATLEVVLAVLGGLLNARLVARLAASGRRAVGLTGADAGLLAVRPLDSGLGHVAQVVGVDGAILERLLAGGLTPVVASIGADASGGLYNINADEVAGSLAAARGGTLLLCTDVPGVIRDGEPIERLEADEADRMLSDGSATAGMRPKLRAALSAARAGCTVRIIDGTSPDAMSAALRGMPTGTRVTAGAVAQQEVS